MAGAGNGGEDTAAGLVFQAASMVPTSHYLLALGASALVFLYGYLEIHILGDILRGCRGDPVSLTFDPASEIFHGVVSKCRILRGRYLATPWLASPHLQTIFIGFVGRSPEISYKRQMFCLSDGGTIALDWVPSSDVKGDFLGSLTRDYARPILVIVPGLSSDSDSHYIKHLVHKMSKHGWNVVVPNHRGTGGVFLTSDCFYNAGWTEDLREIANYLHQEYPRTPLFAVGTSVGANILVKYLGEERQNTPFAGAVSICSPWDFVITDRFFSRKLIQRLYVRALTIGLQNYAKLHKPIVARLANWDGIRKSCSIREFDRHGTCLVGKFETVDTLYRYSSSVGLVTSVSIPLLCINALDDPLCTKEAIPWDECRVNKNIVLAVAAHGGHLGFFQKMAARSLWLYIYLLLIKICIHLFLGLGNIHLKWMA